MPYCIDDLLSNIVAWNWPAVLQGVGAIWVAIVATAALRTWKSQLRTEKELEFIYAITDTVNELLLEIPIPITHLELATIGIGARDGLGPKYQGLANPGAIEFIETRGPEYARKILESLGPIRPIVGKIQALATKGQVFEFPDYHRCLNLSGQLTWVFQQIEAFAVMIGSDHMNWDNPLIQKALSKALAVSADGLRGNLEAQSLEITAYARAIYKRALR